MKRKFFSKTSAGASLGREVFLFCAAAVLMTRLVSFSSGFAAGVMDDYLDRYDSPSRPLNTERIFTGDLASHASSDGNPVYLEQGQNPSADNSSPAPSAPAQIADTGKSSPAPHTGETVLLDSLELVDMDIKDVLKLISRRSGLNIVANGNVAGRVTIFMQNVEVRDALGIILDANDLAYEEEKGMLRVMTAQDYERIYGRRFGQKTQTKIVRLTGLNAIDAVNLLNQMKSVIGRVVADEPSNTVMIEDTPQQVEELGMQVEL